MQNQIHFFISEQHYLMSTTPLKWNQAQLLNPLVLIPDKKNLKILQNFEQKFR